MGLSNRQIADILGVSEATVKRISGKTLKRFRTPPPTLQSIRRTLVRLNTVTRYSEEAIAKALLPHVKADQIQFLSEYLSDVAELMRKDDVVVRRCAECGDSIPSRTDARYCSPRCRQRAYRKRVTALASSGEIDASS